MDRRRILLMGGKKTYAQKIKALFGTSLIAYYPMNEASGTVAIDASGNSRNGAYTGVDLSNAAAPAGTKTRAPYFDGTSDYNNIYSAAFNTAFNGQLGTMSIWFLAGTGVLTDGIARNIIDIRVDANNYAILSKNDSGNQVKYYYKAGGGVANTPTYSYSSYTWTLMSMVWNRAADTVDYYINGAVSAVQSATGGAWAGNIGTTTCTVGSYTTTPAAVFKGWLAHAFFLNKAATVAELLAAYNLGK